MAKGGGASARAGLSACNSRYLLQYTCELVCTLVLLSIDDFRTFTFLISLGTRSRGLMVHLIYLRFVKYQASQAPCSGGGLLRGGTDQNDPPLEQDARRKPSFRGSFLLPTEGFLLPSILFRRRTPQCLAQRYHRTLNWEEGSFRGHSLLPSILLWGRMPCDWLFLLTRGRIPHQQLITWCPPMEQDAREEEVHKFVTFDSNSTSK